MNVTEKEVTATQKIYELTEQELKRIKCDAYNDGADHVLRYIIYCIDNTKYKRNLWWISHFVKELCDFKQGKDYMENKNNLTFREFLDRYGR